jgi:hypothetical protein
MDYHLSFSHSKRLFAVLLMTASGAFAQTMSSLRGTIADRSGALMDQVSVSIAAGETGFRRSTLSMPDGTYQFVQVPPGTYTITAQKPGFTTVTQQNISLQVNTPTSLNLALDVASVSESVNVEASVAAINTVDASIGNAFNQAQVRQLPLLTRNVVELLSLQPGVTPTGEVLGSRRDQNNITLDGADVKDNQNRP